MRIFSGFMGAQPIPIDSRSDLEFNNAILSTLSALLNIVSK